MKTFLDIKNQIFRKVPSHELQNISIKNKYGKLDKINSYITYKGLEYLKQELPYLPITEYSIQKNINNLDSFVYVVLKSKNSITHPFIVYANINSNKIYCVMSYGKDKKMGQYALDDFETLLNVKHKDLLTREEYYALFLLFADSIQTRKMEMITHNRFSLLNCNNIKQCVATTNKLKKDAGFVVKRTKKKGKGMKDAKGIYPSKLSKELKDKELYYKKKALVILEKFFKMLDEGNFNEAYKFLKLERVKGNGGRGNGRGGKGRIIQGDYFGKERLDTFFKSNRKLIGHLQIFIDLYQFTHLIISRL
jgi:hypothetical protein